MPVRHAILALLAIQPRHGYELHAAFIALAGGRENWDVKPAQIYTTLDRLKESGMVTVQSVEHQSGPDKTIYSLEPAGRQELDEWLLSETSVEHQHDTFFIKLISAMALQSNTDPPPDPRQLLHIQRNALYRELHRITALRAACNPRQELVTILQMDKAVMHLEADLRWIDMVEARFDEMSAQPLPQPENKPRGRPPKQDE
jgi:DNA-binding PadR family transcriptional regulator